MTKTGGTTEEPGKTRRSDIPFASEFSPTQVRLPHLLELAAQYGDDWKGFEQAIRAAYFEKNATTDYNKSKLANNVRLGMIAYGVIDRKANLTDTGKALYDLRADEAALYRAFTKHILLNLKGMRLVQCVLDIQTAGEPVDLVKLRRWLEERSVHVPPGATHMSKMRLWLEKAGIFSDGWKVDEKLLQEILGTSAQEFDALTEFNRRQKAYLRTLANLTLAKAGPYSSNEVAKQAEKTQGVQYNEKSLPKDVLYRLEKAGYITLARGTKQAGRGAKPFLVTPTEKLTADIILPFLAQVEQEAPRDLRPLLRKPLADILKDLNSPSKDVRGLALEALAFKLMWLLDLKYRATRLGGKATGGAEVDLVFEGSRLVFSRWQVQCKNTPKGSVALEDVAKEIGLTRKLRTNVIVIVSTGKIGPVARSFANDEMSNTHICIIMIDGDDLRVIKDNPTAILEVMTREAQHAMRLKPLNVEDLRA